MIIHSLPRRSGKTTMAVNRLKDDSRVHLLTFNAPRVKQIIDEFRLDKEQAKRVHHPGSWPPQGTRDWLVVIDELGLTLYTMLAANVIMVTVANGEGEDLGLR